MKPARLALDRLIIAGGFSGDDDVDFLNGICCGEAVSAESKSKAYGLLLSSSTLKCVTGLWVRAVVLDLPNFSDFFFVWTRLGPLPPVTPRPLSPSFSLSCGRKCFELAAAAAADVVVLVVTADKDIVVEGFSSLMVVTGPDVDVTVENRLEASTSFDSDNLFSLAAWRLRYCVLEGVRGECCTGCGVVCGCCGCCC